MISIWPVLALALLPGAGNFVGGLMAEFWKASPRSVNWALHAASGIVIGIVAIEIMPEVIDRLAGWWIAAAFAAGGVAYLGLEALTQRLQGSGGSTSGSRTGMWMIYIAVAVDLTSDGLMIGTGSAVSMGLAIVVAGGQVLADVPEGYATVSNFRRNGLPRRRRVLLSVSFFAFVVTAALLSYLLLRNVPEPLKMAALVFIAGLLTVAAVEDMLEEAHEALEDNRGSVLAFVGGFALFALTSAGLSELVLQR